MPHRDNSKWINSNKLQNENEFLKEGGILLYPRSENKFDFIALEIINDEKYCYTGSINPTNYKDTFDKNMTNEQIATAIINEYGPQNIGGLSIKHEQPDQRNNYENCKIDDLELYKFLKNMSAIKTTNAQKYNILNLNTLSHEITKLLYMIKKEYNLKHTIDNSKLRKSIKIYDNINDTTDNIQRLLEIDKNINTNIIINYLRIIRDTKTNYADEFKKFADKLIKEIAYEYYKDNWIEKNINEKTWKETIKKIQYFNKKCPNETITLKDYINKIGFAYEDTSQSHKNYKTYNEFIRDAVK